MKTAQLKELAEDLYDNPTEALRSVLQEVIDEKGMIYNATLKEANQMYSRTLERKIRNYGKQRR
jgi:hypothetical protein